MLSDALDGAPGRLLFEGVRGRVRRRSCRFVTVEETSPVVVICDSPPDRYLTRVELTLRSDSGHEYRPHPVRIGQGRSAAAFGALLSNYNLPDRYWTSWGAPRSGPGWRPLPAGTFVWLALMLAWLSSCTVATVAWVCVLALPAYRGRRHSVRREDPGSALPTCRFLLQ